MNVEKLKRLQAQVRIGGKGTPRRKKKVIHQTAVADDKKLQSSLKKLSVSTIPGIEEVNIIKDDLTVIHFNNPKAQASLSANTFAVTGHGETKKIVEMLPEILPQLGQETVVQLRMFANSMSNNPQQQQQTKAAAAAASAVGVNIGEHILSSVLEEDIDDDDVPMLVSDFDEVAKIEANEQSTTKKPEDIKSCAVKIVEPPVIHENKDVKPKETKDAKGLKENNKKTDKTDDKSKKKEPNKNVKNEATKAKDGTKNSNNAKDSKQQQLETKTKNQDRTKASAEQMDNKEKGQQAAGNKQQQVPAVGADKANKAATDVIGKNNNKQQQQQQHNNKKQNQQKSTSQPQGTATVEKKDEEQRQQKKQQQQQINLPAANIKVVEENKQEPPKAMTVEKTKQTMEIAKPAENKNMENKSSVAVETKQVDKNFNNNQQQGQAKASNKDKKSLKSNKEGKLEEKMKPTEIKEKDEVEEPIEPKKVENLKIETVTKNVIEKEQKKLPEVKIDESAKLEEGEKREAGKSGDKKNTGKRDQKKGKSPEPKPVIAKNNIETPPVPTVGAVALMEFEPKDQTPIDIKETPVKQSKEKSPIIVKETAKKPEEKSPIMPKETEEQLKKESLPLEATKKEETNKTSPNPDAKPQVDMKEEKTERQLVEKTIEVKPAAMITTNETKKSDQITADPAPKAKSPAADVGSKEKEEKRKISPAKDTKSTIASNLETEAPQPIKIVAEKPVEPNTPVEIQQLPSQVEVKQEDKANTEPQKPLMIMPAPLAPMLVAKPETPVEANKIIPQEKIEKKSTTPPKQQGQQQQVAKKSQESGGIKENVQVKTSAAVSAQKSENNKSKQAPPAPIKTGQRQTSKSPAKGQQQQAAKSTGPNMPKKSPEKNVTNSGKASSPTKTNAGPATTTSGTQGAIKKSASPPKVAIEEGATKKPITQQQKPAVEEGKQKQVLPAASKQQKKPITPTSVTPQPQVQNQANTAPKNATN